MDDKSDPELSLAIQDVHQLVGSMIDGTKETDLFEIWMILNFILGHWFAGE